MLSYPAHIKPDAGGFMVSFRDIPEALSSGKTLEEAEAMAADALLTAMDFYFEDRRAVPPPSEPWENETIVPLPASASAKILLLNEMIAQRITPSELARRMNVRKQEVNRIIDIRHATKIDTIAAALACLGRELELSVIEPA
jgi:antitoxin HicB